MKGVGLEKGEMKFNYNFKGRFKFLSMRQAQDEQPAIFITALYKYGQ